MENQFVTYDIAMQLKKLGYNGECFAYYNDAQHPIYEHKRNSDTNKLGMYGKYCAAPLWQQAIDWISDQYFEIPYYSDKDVLVKIIRESIKLITDGKK
jgi:hypothetical protein